MSPPDPRFTLNVAHGISDRVAATWSDRLVRVPRLLVPLQLEVLMVRQDGAQWADCALAVPDESTPQPLDTRALLPPPFQNRSARARGAYLHWALPDALSHGRQTDGSTDTTFPAIPDRWLVLRIMPSPRLAGRRTIRGWLLRAGDRIPRPIDLDAWVETGDEPNPLPALTALGIGDVGWSAYFDNVENRLAFYDALEDVPQGPIAYAVCGWYSRPELDPLSSAHVRSLIAFQERMNQLGWEVPGSQLKEAAERVRKQSLVATSVGMARKARSPSSPAPTAGGRTFPEVRVVKDVFGIQDEWWPNQILCHGSVVGIGWPGIGFRGVEDGLLPRENGGPPAPGSLRVAIGNTTAEAMAALLTEVGRPEDEARILEAFQLGVLNELDEPDGRARVDAALHASAFGSLPGGEIDDRIYEPPIEARTPRPDRPQKPPHGIFDRNFRMRATERVSEARTFPALEKRVDSQIDRALLREAEVLRGSLADVQETVLREPPQEARPGRWVDIKRPLPRFYHPVDPVLLVQGGKRSFRHGGDGRFTANGRLQCRLTGYGLKEVAIVNGEVRLASGGVRAEYALDRGVDNGSVPPDCDDVLLETVILDPGSAESLIRSGRNPRTAAPAPEAVLRDAQKMMVEQTVWWALRDARVDPTPIVARSGLAGYLPSPLAVTPPARPWSPLHLDWQVAYLEAKGRVTDWRLEEIDYNEVPELVPSIDQSMEALITMEGRSGLSANVASNLAAAVRRSIEESARSGGGGKAPPRRAVLQYHSMTAARVLTRLSKLTRPATSDAQLRTDLLDIAEALENMDVLNGVFEDMHYQLRQKIAGDGHAMGTFEDEEAKRKFVAMRTGYMRILRLRLVDCFGQFVDLLGSSETTPADAMQVVTAAPMVVTGREDLQALPPRFTSPARLWFRFVKGAPASPTDVVEARLASDREPMISPICGYVMPNHLDTALEFFSDAGENRGMILPDLEGRILWEDAPGTPVTVGQSPERALTNPFLAAMAQGVLDWGIADQQSTTPRESVLSALLRVIDTTLWSVDPFGHQGDEHLSLLVGHPIAVMRAQLRLEVVEPVGQDLVNRIALQVRLGALTHWQDGLLGYFVNDDYSQLYVPDAASADQARPAGALKGFLGSATETQDFFESFASTREPVQHPYVKRDGAFVVRPNQTVSLTLLVEPNTRVYATTGVVPRKDIGMQREWVQDALTKLAPTFRFGPVLIDPMRVRMPVAHDLNGTWSWDHRVDVNTWASDPVTHATQEALLSADPPQGSEGWLKLTPKTSETEQ